MVTLILPGQLAEARLQFANFTENTQAGLGSGSLRSLWVETHSWKGGGGQRNLEFDYNFVQTRDSPPFYQRLLKLFFKCSIFVNMLSNYAACNVSFYWR